MAQFDSMGLFFSLPQKKVLTKYHCSSMIYEHYFVFKGVILLQKILSACVMIVEGSRFTCRSSRQQKRLQVIWLRDH
jgi:hypothetical protein